MCFSASLPSNRCLFLSCRFPHPIVNRFVFPICSSQYRSCSQHQSVPDFAPLLLRGTCSHPAHVRNCLLWWVLFVSQLFHISCVSLLSRIPICSNFKFALPVFLLAGIAEDFGSRALLGRKVRPAVSSPAGGYSLVCQHSGKRCGNTWCYCIIAAYFESCSSGTCSVVFFCCVAAEHYTWYYCTFAAYLDMRNWCLLGSGYSVAPPLPVAS